VQAPATRLDGTPIRVLVVDDEPSLAELLASALRYEGWDIRTAGDGADAVRTARDFRPDAVPPGPQPAPRQPRTQADIRSPQRSAS